MAHFMGVVKGQSGEASRLGSKKSGLETVCASWQGAVRCYAYHDEKTGEDMVRVSLVQWHGRGCTREGDLYDGPISGKA